MAAVTGLKCIYDTATKNWAVELSLDGETGAKRFGVPGPDHVEAFVESFEEASSVSFDPASGEVSFDFLYAEDADEDEESADEESDDEGEAEKRTS
jgi:hypothetical protein